MEVRRQRLLDPQTGLVHAAGDDLVVEDRVLVAALQAVLLQVALDVLGHAVGLAGDVHLAGGLFAPGRQPLVVLELAQALLPDGAGDLRALAVQTRADPVLARSTVDLAYALVLTRCDLEALALDACASTGTARGALGHTVALIARDDLKAPVLLAYAFPIVT